MGSRPRWRRLGKIIALGTATALVCGIALLLCFEAPIWWELSYAAEETFAGKGEPEPVQLRIDVKENLVRYSPRRLARYLKSPSDKWRKVVCLALGSHFDKVPSHWTGVPAAIARTAVSTADEQLTTLCFEALRFVPEYSKKDVRIIVEALTARPARDSRPLLDALAYRSPRGRDELKAEMQNWLDGPSERRRAAAFEVLVQYFPEEDDAAVAYALTAFKEGVQDFHQFAVLKLLLARRPVLGREFLAGAPGQKHVLWLALAERPPRDGLKDRQFVAAAERAAGAAVASDLKAADLDQMIRFLGGSPNGFSILIQRLDRCDDEFLGKVLGEIRHRYLDARFPPGSIPNFAALEAKPVETGSAATTFRGFTPPEAETFVRLLPRLKSDQDRRAWEFIIGAAIRGKLPPDTFPLGAGPTDPRFADFLAAALDDDRVDAIVEYFEHVSPLASKEIPRILKCLARILQRREVAITADRSRVKENGNDFWRTMRPVNDEPSLDTPGQVRLAILLRRRFSDRPDVQAFFRRYPGALKEVCAPVNRPFAGGLRSFAL